MTFEDGSTDDLLRLAAMRDPTALARLFEVYRPRVRKLVAIHLDRRLSARVDPSDVVQETLAEASRRLDAYLHAPAVPFYPWLRDIAMNRLIDLHRRHMLAGRRSVLREEGRGLPLPEESAISLARRLVGTETTPSRHLERKDQQRRVKDALDRLEPGLREVLVLKYLEDLSSEEIADILGVTVRTVRRRMDFGTRQTYGGMAVQPDGKVVVVGSREDRIPLGKNRYASNKEIVVLRYNTNGSLDDSFGDGKIVAVGTWDRAPRNQFDFDFLVARFQGDPVVPLSASVSLTGGTTSTGRSAATGQPGFFVPLTDHDLTRLATDLILSPNKRRRALKS